MSSLLILLVNGSLVATPHFSQDKDNAGKAASHWSKRDHCTCSGGNHSHQRRTTQISSIANSIIYCQHIPPSATSRLAGVSTVSKTQTHVVLAMGRSMLATWKTNLKDPASMITTEFYPDLIQSNDTMISKFACLVIHV